MTDVIWTINIVGQAKKASKELSKSAAESYSFLLIELEQLGPYRSNWPNYTKTKGSNKDYHCHIYRERAAYLCGVLENYR